MTETRQQRRARERRELEGRVIGSRSIQDLWRIFYDEALKPRGIVEGDPEIDPGLALMRRCFYGGAASMMELLTRLSPDGVSKEYVATLQRAYEELEMFAKGVR